jgi:chromate transporter
VTRRRWLTDSAYADLVALCQFLPGPASSQVGFALGLMRAGWMGALAAFTAFTLPSAAILFAFAMTAASISGPVGLGALAGLKIVAVAIVAQAVLGMARTLCPDRERAAIAAGAVVVLAMLPGAFGMVGAIALGGLAGLALGRGTATEGHVPVRVGRGQGVAALAAFGAPAAPAARRGAVAGAGGGGQLLPRGRARLRGRPCRPPAARGGTVAPGWVTPDAFLAGYGAAQAVPGPLFTFAAYLGAVLGPEPNGIAGAALALLALFLPGFLILVGVLPFWDRFRAMPAAQSAMQGANAAVVGILGAALYSPVFTSAIGDLADFALALVCFVLLVAWKAPPWCVVIVAAAGGAGLALAR